MNYTHFSHNGQILPIDQAVVPLGNIEYSYGFGVYETIRVSKGIIYFIDDHLSRLMQSAKIISLEHDFSPDFIGQAINALLEKLDAQTCNIKILLIGGSDKNSANLYILASNPLFPDRRLYKTGAHVITYQYERLYPQAKTLNMLGSYLAYRQARAAGAYDALLVNSNGEIIEGTRTNFFGLRGRQIFTAPELDILPGVTRDKVIKVARQNNFKIVEQAIGLNHLNQFEAAFLTSTSSKIMPVKTIDKHTYPIPSQEIQELMELFADYLIKYNLQIRH